MTRRIPEDGREDLLERGYSRRHLARIAVVFGVGALAATAGRPAWAARDDDVPELGSRSRVRLGANEWWTGPLAPGQAAAAAIIGSSNRYIPHDERRDFIRTAAVVDSVPEDHVAPWPGSSDPLSRAVVTFCSPARALVTADPTFELAWEAAAVAGRAGPARAADARLQPRREGDGRGRSERRPVLRLQPQQSDRHDHAAGRYRVAGRQQARGLHGAGRRGLHPLRRRPVSRVARRGRQGRDRPAHLLQDLRHGRDAHGLSDGPAGDHS